MQKPRVRIQSGASRSAFMGALSDGYIGNWATWPIPINQRIYNDLRTLRTRCREQALNNDYVIRYLSLMENNIVGADGIRLQARSKDRKGGLDKMANQAVEAAWHDFSKGRNVDFFNEQTLNEFCMMIIRQIAIEGEAFVIKNYSLKNKYGLKLQFIDSERVDIQHNGELANGNLIVMGIEHNPDGQVVAYHFLNKLKTVHEQYNTSGQSHLRVPAENVYHIFRREYPSQIRGVPKIAGSLYRLKLVEQYENVALIASKLGAASGGHYYRDENAGQYSGPVENGQFVEEIEPGKINILPEGYKYEAHDPTYPQQMYADFLKKALRGIASGLNISYNMFANDLEGVNFSSIRTAVLEDREYYRVWQRFLIDKFIERVYEDWLPLALLGGKIVLPSGRPMPAQRVDKLLDVTFCPRKWDWVDPLKDAKAKIELYNAKAATVSSMIRDAGHDPEEVFEERMKENETLALIAEQEAKINEKFTVKDESGNDEKSKSKLSSGEDSEDDD